MCHTFKFFSIQKFRFHDTEEIFNNGIVITVSFARHILSYDISGKNKNAEIAATVEESSDNKYLKYTNYFIHNKDKERKFSR